ncbi:hypothetical protein I4U23_025511 [Adineta vaga]|nr:hypothetical protein I4U23_025511 [Adineta vaga]
MVSNCACIATIMLFTLLVTAARLIPVINDRSSYSSTYRPPTEEAMSWNSLVSIGSTITNSTVNASTFESIISEEKSLNTTTRAQKVVFFNYTTTYYNDYYTSTQGSSLSGGSIAGIVIGVIVLLCCCCGIFGKKSGHWEQAWVWVRH